MVTAVNAWKDSKGKIHPSKHEALLSEIEITLGKLGNGESAVTPGLAKLVADNRKGLLPLLQDFDAPDGDALKPQEWR